jgi:hypothetical protein
MLRCGFGVSGQLTAPPRYDVRMLVATWILAVATALLAVSGPIALLVWLNARRADRERRQREREDESRDRILRSVRDEFVPKTWVGGTVVFAILGCLLAWSSWSDRKGSSSKGVY